MRVLIIEDESLMAEALRDELLALEPQMEIMGMMGSISATLAFLEREGMPDLFFSDIELSDGLSFEIFRVLEQKAPVIFCTAYHHYALEAFQAHGIDYLLKPFDRSDIQATLDKYHQFFPQPSVSQPSEAVGRLENLLEQQFQPQSLLVYKGADIFPLQLGELALLQVGAGHVIAHTFDGRQFVVNQSMDRLASTLGNAFFRVNRQFLIHRKAISHVSPYFSRKLLVNPRIDFSEPLVISKANATNFLRWLEMG
ncbi:LytTR family DNA-binding domain-containing protein [Pontibacter sp. G13]|uniref:LytR/AlgR family response regulator transcription factor n=1 Tax=Pontibacter sp. G13 TaxID=3074898 RepID=UPI00288B79CE|nr:LytTR family DNA-binding domain-containing protein [Pontibacter sp. G13]WNJ18457.1 LytTR family DNA-binding domain-containing protein [Pontibacter sp. G13]